MIRRERAIVFDIDGTLCPKKTPEQSYRDLVPYPEVLTQLRAYRERGFYVILATARNMNTYNGNMGLIVANTAKDLMQWLDAHEIPYDELHMAKPWPGRGGFYVDDRSIRPDEFLRLSYEEILALLGED